MMNGAHVVNDESSLARNSAVFAISSACAIRPSTEIRLTARGAGGAPLRIRCAIGVSIAPGQIAFTRMLQRPYSSAATRVSAITPALAAQYAAPTRTATIPAIDA